MRVLESKAEKDPDWFFEIADRFDIDPMEIMEPSESRKQEKQSGRNMTQAATDNEVDAALERMESSTSPETQESHTEPTPTETPKPEPTNTVNERAETKQTNNSEIEDEEDNDEEQDNSDEAFDEIFG